MVLFIYYDFNSLDYSDNGWDNFNWNHEHGGLEDFVDFFGDILHPFRKECSKSYFLNDNGAC